MECLPNAGRDSIRRALAVGQCTVDGVVRHWGFKLKPEMCVVLDPAARITDVLPENIPLEVLWEDDDLLAINKPSGMLVHPTTHERLGTVANALRGLGLREACILHRIDRGTSGVLLCAKRLPPHSPLSQIFESREAEKLYLAVTTGGIAWTEKLVNLPIGRDPVAQPRWAVRSDGAEAVTLLRVRARRPASSILEAIPVTGRTNQIRIHCSSLGHPLLGDPLYGGPPAPRLMLHAASLSFPDRSGQRRTVVAPAPREFEG